MSVVKHGTATRTGWDASQVLNVVDRPLGPERTLDAFRDFTSSKNYVETARMLNREDAAKLVDVFDEVIGSDLRIAQSKTLLRALGSICSATGQLPHPTILSDGLKRCGEIAVASGGFTDTWLGRYKTKYVALKAFRTYPLQDLKEAEKILWKEVVLWKRLSHEHVLPFYGVDKANFQLALVYDWADSGNIIQYLDSNPQVSRIRLLREVAEGLRYLHSYGVVHGDLKGTNVLISRSGHARLSDYGLMPIQSNHAFMIAATPGVVGISRWLAPELIDPPRKKGHRQPAGTGQADIFAFAMLVIEVLTGELPFGDVRHESAILMIAHGKRPEKPQDAESLGLTTEMWKFIQRCWHQNPSKRPDINTVVTAWQKFDSQESSRRSALAAADTIYQEKHKSQVHKSFAKSTDKPKRTWFCGLF
ncbi:kinase-like protein [Thelephora ganbajun]|uniref:Kinase-like protein n=1 Tax=Thelephora ganbajun TaxID=370292 RepID=A0ACB6ZBF7_THEGA|nr:kinase-like protein [Thelephora ganbajun]